MSSLFGNAAMLAIPRIVSVTVAPITGFHSASGKDDNGSSHCAAVEVVICQAMAVAPSDAPPVRTTAVV